MMIIAISQFFLQKFPLFSNEKKNVPYLGET